MKIIIKDVGYNRGYVIGPYLQERPGVNADIVLEEGEDQESCTLKALHYLKSIADKFHKEANPHLSFMQDASYVPPPSTFTTTGHGDPMVIDYKKWDAFEKEVEESDSMDALNTLLKNYGDTFPGKYLSIINAKRQSFNELNNKA